MAKHTELMAEARAKAGKGSARAVRRQNKIPGVIYGDNKDPILVSVTEKDLAKAVATSHFFTSICDLSVDGKKHSVLPRDIQLHPVSDKLEHVDFLRVTDKTEIRVEVPVHLVNIDKCKGVSKGGVINLLRHELDIMCMASNIPENIEVDVKDINVGDSVHLSLLQLPKGVRLLDDEELTLLTIVAPSAMKSDDDAKASSAVADTAAAPAAGAKAPAAGAKAAAPAAGKAAPAAAKAPAAPAKKK